MKRLLMVLFSLLLLGGCGSYSVTEPYAYPVKPGTEEWAKLEGLQARIEACSVSSGLMKKMTTAALVDTVMEYPLLSEIIMASIGSTGLDSNYEHRIRQAFSALAEDFQGVEILRRREDAEGVIKEYLLNHNLNEEDQLFAVSSMILEYISFNKK